LHDDRASRAFPLGLILPFFKLGGYFIRMTIKFYKFAYFGLNL